MNSSVTIRTGDYGSNFNSLKNGLSTDKAIGFAILIILCCGALVVAAVGLGGYLQAGSLNSIGQLNSIIMMAAGSTSGIICLIVLIVKSNKNQQANNRQHIDGNEDAEPESDVNINSEPTKNANIVATTDDMHHDLIYGSDAYKKWHVTVLDDVPEPPKIDLSKRDKILLYIPLLIEFEDNQIVFNLEALKEIKSDSFSYFNSLIMKQFKKTTAAGWVLIDMTVHPDSLKKNYEAQKKMVEEKGCQMPSVFEAIVLNLMVCDFTGQRLYGQASWNYTCCVERVDGKHPVIVGYHGPACGLSVYYDNDGHGINIHGVACAQRKILRLYK